jgi:hypothetical protein
VEAQLGFGNVAAFIACVLRIKTHHKILLFKVLGRKKEITS